MRSIRFVVFLSLIAAVPARAASLVSTSDLATQFFAGGSTGLSQKSWSYIGGHWYWAWRDLVYPGPAGQSYVGGPVLLEDPINSYQAAWVLGSDHHVWERASPGGVWSWTDHGAVPCRSQSTVASNLGGGANHLQRGLVVACSDGSFQLLEYNSQRFDWEWRSPAPWPFSSSAGDGSSPVYTTSPGYTSVWTVQTASDGSKHLWEIYLYAGTWHSLDHGNPSPGSDLGTPVFVYNAYSGYRAILVRSGAGVAELYWYSSQWNWVNHGAPAPGWSAGEVTAVARPNTPAVMAVVPVFQSGTRGGIATLQSNTNGWGWFWTAPEAPPAGYDTPIETTAVWGTDGLFHAFSTVYYSGQQPEPRTPWDNERGAGSSTGTWISY